MRVGYKLYRQIRDFAPQNWTSGELVVAFIIADSAGEDTRRSYIDNPELCRRARMTSRGVSKALERLAERGFEFRVSKGKDRNGKEVYAVSGKRTEYQVPDIFMLLERGAAVAYGLVDKLAAGGTTVPAAEELSTETSRYHSTGEPVPQYRLRRSHALILNLRPSKPPKHLTKLTVHTPTAGSARELSTGENGELELEADDSKFEGWVILEVMGHRRLAGYLTEQEIAGKAFLRIDIPTEPPSTQFYGAESIYCLTPTTEETARAACGISRVAPVARWELPAPPEELAEHDPSADFADYGEELEGSQP